MDAAGQCRGVRFTMLQRPGPLHIASAISQKIGVNCRQFLERLCVSRCCRIIHFGTYGTALL